MSSTIDIYSKSICKRKTATILSEVLQSTNSGTNTYNKIRLTTASHQQQLLRAQAPQTCNLFDTKLHSSFIEFSVNTVPSNEFVEKAPCYAACPKTMRTENMDTVKNQQNSAIQAEPVADALYRQPLDLLSENYK
ncbi:hypothetical protein GCM10017044_20940 [Kordiimonas sediminis]|uniref:Uncharacterized protein n=1 Tax=Kordiimonas sediminis TaxID=1735581 RepID=A0A919ATX3_9PROT|nr:hypothetical protein [Kordiimonas sediminis]GHF25910.1 hypothetical protein GCM10017044_20940 [Kordiimonas sediminis]